LWRRVACNRYLMISGRPQQFPVSKVCQFLRDVHTGLILLRRSMTIESSATVGDRVPGEAEEAGSLGLWTMMTLMCLSLSQNADGAAVEARGLTAGALVRQAIERQ